MAMLRYMSHRKQLVIFKHVLSQVMLSPSAFRLGGLKRCMSVNIKLQPMWDILGAGSLLSKAHVEEKPSVASLDHKQIFTELF